MKNINELKQEIECRRTQMYRAYENNPDDPQVLIISQKLDELLNELNRSTR